MDNHIIRIAKKNARRKVRRMIARFLLLFFLIGTLVFGLLYGSGLLSYVPKVSMVSGAPEILSIPELEKALAIQNPSEGSKATLFALLRNGVVRHPESKMLGEKGRIILLGHSTHLSVRNAHYQAFNGVENLLEGAIIALSQGERTVRYRIYAIEEEHVDDLYFSFDAPTEELILVTCNTLGEAGSRFTVYAKRIL